MDFNKERILGKSIYIGLDHNCYTIYRKQQDILGGTERLMITIAKWLKQEGYEICKDKNPGNKEYDLAIFSNVSDDRVISKKRILFSGSWHTDAATAKYDEVANVSEYMREQTGRGVIISAPFTNDVKRVYADTFTPNLIFCNANPCKYYRHIKEYIEILDSYGEYFHFAYTGGNKLYSDNFGEGFSTMYHPKMNYRGVLSRKEMLGLLSSAHVFVLPAFTSEAPTFEVAPLEAMALGISTILPDVKPYNQIHKGATLCRDVKEMVEETIKALKIGRVEYDVERYSEDVVREQWISLVKKTIGD